MTPVRFESIGGDWIDPPMLMPASIPLELSGEAVRSRLLTSSDAPGEELALRPDLTLAVVRHHIEAGASGPVSYRYLGKAFRQPVREGETAEFYQTGFECFGHDNRFEQDITAISAICHDVREAGLEKGQLFVGDISLFNAFVKALDLSPFWSAQLRRAFRRREGIQQLLNQKAEAPRSALAMILAELPEDQAGALLDEVLSFSGGQVIGGRTRDDILGRLQHQAEAVRVGPLDARARKVLGELIHVEGRPEDVLKSLTMLAQGHQLKLDEALSKTAELYTRLSQNGAPFWDGAHVSIQFGRRFDYYDGLVFELQHTSLGPKRPIANGGRYDDLVRRLSQGESNTPAIGAVIRPDRLERALAAEGNAS